MRNKIVQIILLSLPLITVISAQPPGFPGAPNQAPIGGLGLLAAAGGAMALKKLYDKRNDK